MARLDLQANSIHKPSCVFGSRDRPQGSLSTAHALKLSLCRKKSNRLRISIKISISFFKKCCKTFFNPENYYFYMRNLIAAFFMVSIFIHNSAFSVESDPPVTLKIVDFSPKFLKFYEKAKSENLQPDARWALWKKMVNFAAVPPTDAGQQLAREMLDNAWSRYPDAMEQISAGAPGMLPRPEDSLKSIVKLLKPVEKSEVTLITFVGAFDNNAFTSAGSGKIMTALPVEMDQRARKLVTDHELTHAVHIGIGSISGGWERSIGATVLSEGLAMRVTQELNPDLSDASYVDFTPGWLVKADKKREEIIKGIKPFLFSSDSADVMKFTMGNGTTGIEREAYYVGWIVVKYWMEKGMTLAEIARIPEKEMPNKVAEALDSL
jgi:uncharacterized protein YjaZ